MNQKTRFIYSNICLNLLRFNESMPSDYKEKAIQELEDAIKKIKEKK